MSDLIADFFFGCNKLVSICKFVILLAKRVVLTLDPTKAKWAMMSRSFQLA